MIQIQHQKLLMAIDAQKALNNRFDSFQTAAGESAARSPVLFELGLAPQDDRAPRFIGAASTVGALLSADNRAAELIIGTGRGCQEIPNDDCAHTPHHGGDGLTSNTQRGVWYGSQGPQRIVIGRSLAEFNSRLAMKPIRPRSPQAQGALCPKADDSHSGQPHHVGVGTNFLGGKVTGIRRCKLAVLS